MKLRGPIITLAVVGVLGLVLIAVNVSKTPEPAANKAAPAAAASEPAEPAAQTQKPSAEPTKPPPFPDDAAFVGHTSGGEVAVAVAVKDGKAAAYICDGESIEAWMQGEVTGAKLTLKGEGDAKLTASADGDALFGRVWAGGKKWPYSAALAGPPAGLYEGEGTVNGQSNRIGWIVLPDGRQVGIRSSGGEDVPAPALDLDQGGAIVDGVFISAERVDGGDDVG